MHNSLYEEKEFEVYTAPAEQSGLWKFTKAFGLICWAGMSLGLGLTVGHFIVYYAHNLH